MLAIVFVVSGDLDGSPSSAATEPFDSVSLSKKWKYLNQMTSSTNSNPSFSYSYYLFSKENAYGI